LLNISCTPFFMWKNEGHFCANSVDLIPQTQQ